jgi:hypothetical protein
MQPYFKASDFIITEAYSNGLKEQPSNSTSIQRFQEKNSTSIHSSQQTSKCSTEHELID